MPTISAEPLAVGTLRFAHPTKSTETEFPPKPGAFNAPFLCPAGNNADPPALASRIPPVVSPAEISPGGTMRPKVIVLAIAVVAASFFVSLKAMDWLSSAVPSRRRRLPNCRRCRRHPHLQQSSPRSRFRSPPFARPPTAPRRATSPGRLTTRCRRSSKTRYRLDRIARADRGDRRAGRAVAGDAVDGKAERDGLAVVKGDRRGRRRARRPARRQCRQAKSAA